MDLKLALTALQKRTCHIFIKMLKEISYPASWMAHSTKRKKELFLLMVPKDLVQGTTPSCEALPPTVLSPPIHGTDGQP